MARGTLRIYLGASPGVGKTFAMLAEGNRRKARGTDVVVGLVETHGRENTAAQLGDLEIVQRREVAYRGTVLHELDVAAVIARNPAVALVDEYAHTNAPGSHNAKRWQDVEQLLDAGIDVISTLNIQHLESLNDVVFRITGVQQGETVPDAIVRRAEQIELVDMAPEAIRRRMAHGNIYPAERIDAALSNYFRPGNLGALRELALLWLADRVEESLADYLEAHQISRPWETRERVVVALSGTRGGERAIRRAARLAGRTRGGLIGVHITIDDGLSATDETALDEQRRLLEELGGRYCETVGHDRAEALAAFSRREKATQVVLLASQRSRWSELWRGSTVARLARALGDIDVHVIAAGREGEVGSVRPAPRRALPLGRDRRRALFGWAGVVAGLPLLTLALVPARERLNLSTLLLIELAAVLTLAAVGGTLVAIAAAVAASLLVNWHFVPPHGTLTIAEPQNVAALAVFLVVAVTVGFLVDLTARRATEARRARLEAEALVRSTTSLAVEPDPLPGLVDQIRTTFALDGVRLRGAGLDTAQTSGDVAAQPTLSTHLAPDGQPGLTLETFGRVPGTEERALFSVLGDQLALAVGAQRLSAEAQAAARLAEIDAVRTGMLRSVSHDLRTPLASIKAMVSGMLDRSVRFTPDQVREALETVNEETDRLTRLVEDLLDASRLQSGQLAVYPELSELESLIAGAQASLSVIRVPIHVDISPEAELAQCDPKLLERAIANLLANAQQFSPAEAAINVEVGRVAERVLIRIIDRGPGIPPGERERVTAPFQRLGDTSRAGVGLGLAIVEGFVEAMGGELLLDDTPGGGLTATISLPSGAAATPVSPVSPGATPFAAAEPA